MSDLMVQHCPLCDEPSSCSGVYMTDVLVDLNERRIAAGDEAAYQQGRTRRIREALQPIVERGCRVIHCPANRR